MTTSLLEGDDYGPALNKTHIVTTVSGIRRDVPDGWINRREEAVKTLYGHRIDIVYEYPDGSTVRR